MPGKPQPTDDECKAGQTKIDTFGLSPLVRAQKLVNNEYMADVVFKVGQSGTVVYAHRLIITMASEVFYAQFNGQFAEAKQDPHANPIAITDIEAGPFLEVLRYIYCQEATIGHENMLDVYYAAEKYMLSGLQLLCEDAFYRNINEDNVLEVFHRNRCWRFAVVDKICLSIICDNPLKYFKEHSFLMLDRVALELIASSAMNCHVEQLEKAIGEWEIKNGKANINIKPPGRLCRKFIFYCKGSYRTNIDTYFTLSAKKPIVLYGIAILIGAQSGSIKSGSTVTIDLMINSKLLLSKICPISDEIETHKLMFEKVVVQRSCEIKVNVRKPDQMRDIEMFCLQSFDFFNVPKGVDIRLSNTSLDKTQNMCNNCYNCEGGRNCVSYLLYQVKH